MSHSFSSPKSFSLKLETNYSAGMWDVQEYQAGATGHFSPSLSVLVLSVSYETSCQIMDFLRYGLRERLISWGFFLCHDILHNHLIIHHFNRQKRWDLPGKMLLSTWLEICLRNVLKSFCLYIPLGFSENSLFCSECSCGPSQAFCSFSSLPDSHNIHLGQAVVIAERKTKILILGPWKGWMTEFRISISWFPALWSLLVYVMQKIPLSLLTSHFFIES